MFVCFAINQLNRNILVVRDSLVSTFEKQQQYDFSKKS